MDIRVLFLNKIQELRRLLAEPNEFNMILASAIVRQLLIDDCPLLTVIARETGQPLLYQTGAVGMVEWAKSITGSYPAVFTCAHSLGITKFAGSIRALKIKEFLSLDVLVLTGDVYTVYDVITYCANAAGGIHHTPKGDRLKNMLEKPEITLGNVSIIPQLMEGIADSVAWACRPHEFYIMNRLGREALAAGHPHIAVSYFENLILESQGIENQRPDLRDLFVANLAEAREAVAQYGPLEN